MNTKRKSIKFLFQYHNNVFDTVRALERDYNAEFLSYRTGLLAHGIRNRKPVVVNGMWRRYKVWDLAKVLRKNTDILVLKHVNEPLNMVPYILAWLLRIKCVVITQRLGHREFWGYVFYLGIVLRILRIMGVYVMATTKDSYSDLNSIFERISYIPACIEVDRWDGKFEQGRKIKTSEFNLLAVAKYQKRKNLALLLKVFRDLVMEYEKIDWQLTIVGKLGPGKDALREHGRIQGIIKKNKLEHSVNLLSDVPLQEMPEHYSKADICILPAESEPLGYAVVEAMAMSKPVICTDQTGAASYINHAMNGYVCETGSSQALMNAVKEFMVDEQVDTQKIDNFGRNSRSLIERNHGPDVFLRKFEKLLCK